MIGFWLAVVAIYLAGMFPVARIMYCRAVSEEIKKYGRVVDRDDVISWSVFAGFMWPVVTTCMALWFGFLRPVGRRLVAPTPAERQWRLEKEAAKREAETAKLEAEILEGRPQGGGS